VVAEGPFSDIAARWSSGKVSAAATSGGSSVAAVSVVADGAKTPDSTHPLFPDAGSTICAHPESVAATRALAPACALPIMSAVEDGPLRIIAAEVIVTSSLGTVGDGSPLGLAGAKGWLATGGEASLTGGTALGAVA
jgi:hypothetical protein